MDEDIRGVLSPELNGPPLGIRAADIIEQGGRIRRRRKRLAVAGSSLATVAVLAIGAMAVGARGGDAPPPVEPAGPGLSTISPAPSIEPPPTARPAPETEAKPEGRPGTMPTPGPPRTTTPLLSQPDPPGRTTVPSPPSARRSPSAIAPPMLPPTEATGDTRAR